MRNRIETLRTELIQTYDIQQKQLSMCGKMGWLMGAVKSVSGSRSAAPLSGRTLLLVAGVCLSHAALAGLGKGPDSVSADRAALRGVAEAVTPFAAYDLHEITTEDGGRVREYVSRTGTVFGVAWNGRTKPDLSALLGSHYADYLKAAASNHLNHKVLTISSGDFAMQIMKLPRSFTGSAYLPALLPSGTNSHDIR